MLGWRPSTIDIDLRLEPDADDILHAIAELKEELATNVELASPLDFIPEPPGWRERSPFLVQEGGLTVRHRVRLRHQMGAGVGQASRSGRVVDDVRVLGPIEAVREGAG